MVDAIKDFLDECNDLKEESKPKRQVVKIEQSGYYDKIFYDDGTISEFYVGD